MIFNDTVYYEYEAQDPLIGFMLKHVEMNKTKCYFDNVLAMTILLEEPMANMSHTNNAKFGWHNHHKLSMVENTHPNYYRYYTCTCPS